MSGEIGGANIRHGKMRLNNIIYRWLGNREYIIDAELSNYIIEKEKIHLNYEIRVFSKELEFIQRSLPLPTLVVPTGK